MNCMWENGNICLKLPGSSPDVISIENLWAICKKKSRTKCATKDNMISALIQVWFHNPEMKEMCTRTCEFNGDTTWNGDKSKMRSYKVIKHQL